MPGSGIANQRRHILLGIGAVLAVAGLVLVTWAFVPLEGTKTRTIPLEPDVENPIALVDGDGIWVLMKYSMWFRGELSATMAATSPTGMGKPTLGWKVIDQSTYETYRTEGVINEVLFGHIGINDTASHICLPTSGNYYLILFNDLPLVQEFNVTIHYRMSGINLVFFVPGVLMLLAGTPLLVFGIFLCKRKGV